MERIKKALELARLEREQHSRPAAASVAPLLAKPHAVATTRTVRLSAEHLERHRVLHAGSDESVRRAYKMLRTQVLQRMRANNFQTLAVVSPGPADGKSLTAVNLAISIAQDPNHTALLVDLDLRRPSICGLFGHKAEHGVDDCLRSQEPLAQAFFRPEQYEKLVVLGARAPVEASSELLAGPETRAMIEEIRGRYADRIVLIDLPPVLVSDDALALTPAVDCVLLVAAEGHTRRDELVRSLEILRSTKVIGTVLNRSDEPAASVY